MSDSSTTQNADPHELDKFSPARPPLVGSQQRIQAAARHQPAAPGLYRQPCRAVRQAVLDVGCGGGILSESMAARGANVTGIDLGEKALKVAKLHLLESGQKVDYRQIAVEELAQEQPGPASTWSPAWKCWNTCPTRPASCEPARSWSSPAAMCSSPPSTAIRSPICSPSSAPNTCSTCCRAARTNTPNSSSLPNWRGYCRAAGLSVAEITGMSYNPLLQDLLAGRRHRHQLPDRIAGKRDQMIKAVLFDLDGTLADTALDLGYALNEQRDGTACHHCRTETSAPMPPTAPSACSTSASA